MGSGGSQTLWSPSNVADAVLFGVFDAVLDDVRCGLITAAIRLVHGGAELILMVGTLKHEQSY